MVRRGTSVTSVFVCLCLVSCQVMSAQESSSSDGLKIVIIQGDSFTNNVKKRTESEPIVEIRDRNNSPVSGAIVTFTLPQNGAGGTFTANSGKVITMTTNSSGRATATFRPVGQGAFKINVSAQFQGQAASTAINQTNAIVGAVAGAGAAGGGTILGMSTTTFAVVAASVAAAAAAGVAAKVATSGGPTAKVRINGTPTVGAP